VLLLLAIPDLATIQLVVSESTEQPRSFSNPSSSGATPTSSTPTSRESIDITLAYDSAPPTAEVSAREGDSILLTHEGGVDVEDVDAKALILNLPVIKPFPSREEITSTLLKHVPADQ